LSSYCIDGDSRAGHAPSVLGFAVINGFTFSVDLACLACLAGLHGTLGWPLPLAITLASVTAFGLSYALNRALNFRSHSPVGPQLAMYVAVVIVNYLAGPAPAREPSW
jgi:putative flippase GtrA